MSDNGAVDEMVGAPVLHPSGMFIAEDCGWQGVDNRRCLVAGLENRIDFKLQRSFKENIMNLVSPQTYPTQP